MSNLVSDLASVPTLDHVNTWVFDLDNTLYPESCNLFDEIHHRMMTYIVDLLKISHAEAGALRKSFYEVHGTTLNGLMMEYGADPHPFLDYVHDIDLSPVKPAPRLADLIKNLPGRALVHTNGSRGHAERVLAKLGIGHAFEGIFDIVASDFVPKPKREAFERFLAQYDVEPKTAVLFEDKVENLQAPHQLGMATVWVNPAASAAPPAPEAYIHHITAEIGDFLQKLSR